MNQQLTLILINVNYFMPIIIAFVFVLKIALYLKFKTNNWTLANLFYFKYKQIVTSKPKEKVNVKIVENSLTYYLLFLVAIDLIVVAYTKF